MWERGLGHPPVERALLLLSAACPETPRAALADLSIGTRDAWLLRLREWTFGAIIPGIAACPGCAQQVEINFGTAILRNETLTPGPHELAVSVADFTLTVRLPTSADLIAVAADGGSVPTRRLLFERCLVSAQHSSAAADIAELPDEAVDAVAHALAGADPLAAIELDIACPHCGHAWRSTFDIVGFFWSEIEAWACRLLREVHELASAYGWSEERIVALGPVRRQFYLELVRA